MKRTASCQCGQLAITCDSEPVQTIMCHCQACQRRSGSAFVLGSWFERSTTSASGEEKLFRRTGDQGGESVYHFCPNCGTSVYWEAPAVFPELLSIAVGCFTDPNFPAPTFSLYAEHRFNWVQQPTGIPSHEAGVGSKLE